MMVMTNISMLVPAPAHAAAVLPYRQTTCASEGSRGDATVLAERRMR